MNRLQRCSPLLVRAQTSFMRPTDRASTTSMAVLRMFHKGRASEVPPTLERLPSHNLTKYHYLRPIFQSTVASATVFSVASLANVLEDKQKEKGYVNVNTDWSLIGMNALVFGCWRIKGLQRFMKTYFMHRVEPGRCITLLSACFSHRTVIHFIPNMALLYYFLSPVQELSNRYEIVAVYLTSGMFGFAASHVNRLALYRIYNQKLLPSLGASGALTGIMAIAYSWLDRDTHLSKTGVHRDVFVVQVASDLIGIICRWGVVDFSAHLGGAIFGCLYAAYGRDYLWHPLVLIWRKLLSK